MSISVTRKTDRSEPLPPQGSDALLASLGELGIAENQRVFETPAFDASDAEPPWIDGLAPELPRARFDGMPENVSAFGPRAGEVFGRNPIQTAAVILGGAAAVVTGTAGVALSQTLDTDLVPHRNGAGDGHVHGATIGHDAHTPIIVARDVLFRADAANAVSVLSNLIRGGAMLEAGARGAEVTELQSRLSAIGITVPASGSFDAATVDAVKNFQRLYGVQQTGKFGPLSLDRLEAGERVTEPGRTAVGDVYVGGRRTGTIDLVFIDGKPVSVDTANALRPMFVAAANAPRPVNLSVVSGHRTNDEQRELYNDYRARRGPLAARPGHSNHQNGRAVDLNTGDPGVYTWLKNNARKYGFIRTVKSEPWHWEYLPHLIRR